MVPARLNTSHATPVRGARKRYNLVIKCPFFTRFPLIPSKAPRETPKNIDTDLSDAMDKQTLWGHKAWAVNALNHTTQ